MPTEFEKAKEKFEQTVGSQPVTGEIIKGKPTPYIPPTTTDTTVPKPVVSGPGPKGKEEFESFIGDKPVVKKIVEIGQQPSPPRVYVNRKVSVRHPTDLIDVSYETSSGESKTVVIQARFYEKKSYEIEQAGGTVYRVFYSDRSYGGSGEKGTILFESERPSEYKERAEVHYEKQQLTREQYLPLQRYETTGEIPSDSYRELKGKTPDNVKKMGLTDLYVRLSYEASIGYISEDDANRQINQVIKDRQTVEWAKDNLLFDNPLTEKVEQYRWAELKSHEPALFLEKTSKGFNVLFDPVRWQQEQDKKYRDDFGYQVGKTLSSVFSPERVTIAAEQLLTGIPEKKITWAEVGKPIKGKTSPWYKVYDKRRRELLAIGHYEYSKAYIRGDVLTMAGRIVSSPVVSVPFTGVITRGLKLFSLTRIGMKPIIKVGSKIIKPSTMVGATILTGSGVLIGKNLYESYVRSGEKGVRRELGKLALTLPLHYYAARWGMGYTPKRTIVGREYPISGKQTHQVLGTQKYVDVMGKRILYGRFEPVVGRVRTGFEPDITGYRGLQMVKTSEPVITPIPHGWVEPMPFKPIPMDKAIVPYTSLVPSTQVGMPSIVGAYVNLVPIVEVDKITSLKGFISGYKPGVVKKVMDTPERIIDFKGTPKDLMKPVGYRELMGKPKYMPDLTKHLGHPLNKKTFEDWIDKKIPSVKTLSTKVSPKPVVFRAYETMGYGEIKIIPIRYITKKGPTTAYKIEHRFIKTKDIKPEPIFPKKIQPYIRMIDQTGKQIGHSFIDVNKKPIIPTKQKPIWTKKTKGYPPSEKMEFIPFKELTPKTMEVGKLSTPKPLRKNIFRDMIQGKNVLPTYKDYKGYFQKEKKPGTSLIPKPVTSLITTKPPTHFVFILFEPTPKPITSIKYPKGKTWTLKDLTKKWEREIGKGKKYTTLGGKKGGRQQQIILEKPKIKTEPPIKPSETGKLVNQKVSEQWLKKIGRFDIEEYIRKTMTTSKQTPTMLLGLKQTRQPVQSMTVLVQPSSKTITGQKITQTLLGKQKISEKQMVDTAQSYITTSIPTVTIDIISKQDRITQNITEQILSTQTKTKKKKIPKKLPLPSTKNLIKNIIKTKDEPGYIVRVKPRIYKHGKRIRKDTTYPVSNSLRYMDALSLGADIVGKSEKATFIIEPTTKKPKKLRKKVTPFMNVAHQFDVEGNKYVEKSKHRIDSKGELINITYRGIKARKQGKGNKKTKNKKVDVNIKNIWKKMKVI
jgi:hypothetical protein